MKKFAIVISRFNPTITEGLLAGAIEAFGEAGIQDVPVTWVPGAFEIPLIAQRYARSKEFDAILCLGAVIRGETDHYDFVAGEVASGIMQVSLETDVPVLFGVLTTENYAQAEARSGAREGNVGFNYAISAMEMANINVCV